MMENIYLLPILVYMLNPALTKLIHSLILVFS